MDSKVASNNKPHVVCIPAPAQSHIKAMLKFLKLLHHRGFHITFVNSEFNHKRFLKSWGPNSLDGLPDFQFKAIPDGLPDSDADTTQDVPLLCDSIRKQNFLAPFRELLIKLNGNVISTSTTSSNLHSFRWFHVAVHNHSREEIEVPMVLFYTIAACSFMGVIQFRALVEKGLAPLKDDICLTNGYLEKVIDWIPGMKDIRLRELPTFIRTSDPDDIMFNFMMKSTERAHKASAVVLHTFDALEPDVLEAFSSMLPLVYPIGYRMPRVAKH